MRASVRASGESTGQSEMQVTAKLLRDLGARTDADSLLGSEGMCHRGMGHGRGCVEQEKPIWTIIQAAEQLAPSSQRSQRHSRGKIAEVLGIDSGASFAACWLCDFG